MRFAGVILCGGKSSRMGYPKAMLPFGDQRMLQRVESILSAVVGPIIVVAAKDQPLPSLLPNTTVVRDRAPERGPLEGIGAGLLAAEGEADAAYVTSCDVPLLSSDFVRYILDRLGDYDIVVAKDEQHFHPLAAVYRVGIRAEIEKLLAENRMRPRFLFDIVRTRQLGSAELSQVDPQLHSLANLNRLEDYLAALKHANLSLDSAMSEHFGLDPT